ncbi:hypothetical protein PRUPE_2G036900 [Prunus persica]|uniref:Uncharacterized protein n=1 Tax=Prunus persica TaxID=3760 RepID=M5XJL5_PRUPE|nr:hypothetical protein PRUPE_2G036900 [Prunus persica]
MKMLFWNSQGSGWPGFILQALFYISTSSLNVFYILDSRASRVELRLLLRGLVLMVSFVSMPLVIVDGYSYCGILLLLI